MLRTIHNRDKNPQRSLQFGFLTCSEFENRAQFCQEFEVSCGVNEYSCKCTNGQICSAFSNGTFFGNCPCPISAATQVVYIATGAVLGLMALFVFVRWLCQRRKKQKQPAVPHALVVTNPALSLSSGNPMAQAVPIAVIVQQKQNDPY